MKEINIPKKYRQLSSRNKLMNWYSLITLFDDDHGFKKTGIKRTPLNLKRERDAFMNNGDYNHTHPKN